MHEPVLPPSVSSFRVNLVGGIVFILCAIGLRWGWPALDNMAVAGVALAVCYITLITLEVYVLNVGARDTVQAQRINQPRSAVRIGFKLLGLAVILLAIALAYTLIPFYAANVGFYPLIAILPQILSLIFIISAGYLVWSDGRFSESGGLYEFGQLLLGRMQSGIWQRQRDFLLMLLLRAFFVPIMLLSVVQFSGNFLGDMPARIHAALPNLSAHSWLGWLFTLYFCFAVVDVVFALLGYLATFKALDSHVRSVFHSPLAWAVCLLSYPPFFNIALIYALFKPLFTNPQWYSWLANHAMLLNVWGVAVVLAMAAEAFCALTFGVRFSNLTYRGLVTSGLYAYTKHPQYIAKLLHRFLVYLPFFSLYGLLGIAANLGSFISLCGLFWLRARTEEDHLRQYPEYNAYADYISQRGIFRKRF